MTEVEVTRTEIKTFKARIKATKPHWVGKAISHRHKLSDGVEPSFSTYMTAFIPKLTFKQKIPVVMLHISNGGGSVLLRSKDPLQLARDLEDVAGILRTDIWLDMFQQMQDIAAHLTDSGEICMDPLFVDSGSFKKQAGLKKNETFPYLEVTQ